MKLTPGSPQNSFQPVFCYVDHALVANIGVLLFDWIAIMKFYVTKVKF